LLHLDRTGVRSLPDSASLKNAFQVITKEEKSFTVYTKSSEEKDAWIKDIR